MRFAELTPAAQRACEAAQRAYRGGDVLPVLLAALADEPECRAAAILARAGISAEELRVEANGSGGSADEFHYELRELLRPLRTRFHDLSPQPAWATEHLLLAAAMHEGEAGQWLRERGLEPDRIEAEIRRIYDLPAGPIDVAPSCQLVAEAVHGVDPPTPQATSWQLVATEVDRILDAAGNRASEGLRVVEDYLRFGLDDAHLTRLAKDLRHQLAAALEEAVGSRRLTARDTAGDVGTSVEGAGEYRRAGIAELLAANFQRSFQALRSLEEYAKVATPAAARRFEAIRYRAYTLERAIFTTQDAAVRLARARLYVLLDGRKSSEEFAALAESLVAAGVHVLQLRDKKLADRELLLRARQLREITAGTPTLCILNDRPDLAVLAQADGVHVGQEELSVRDVRRIVGPEMLVGVSTHSIEQARQAVLDGASYLGVGPTFPSGTKDFASFPGLPFLAQVAAEIRLPCFAIGGITPGNLDSVLNAGATRVAIGGAVTQAKVPGSTAKAFLERLLPAMVPQT